MTSRYDEYSKLYDRPRWRRIRIMQLQLHPLCANCAKSGQIVAASVVHHVVPHKGDLYLFFCGKLESLCKPCHDGPAQQVEKRGYDKAVGTDGWPLDPKHPVYAADKAAKPKHFKPPARVDDDEVDDDDELLED